MQAASDELVRYGPSTPEMALDLRHSTLDFNGWGCFNSHNFISCLATTNKYKELRKKLSLHDKLQDLLMLTSSQRLRCRCALAYREPLTAQTGKFERRS